MGEWRGEVIGYIQDQYKQRHKTHTTHTHTRLSYRLLPVSHSPTAVPLMPIRACEYKISKDAAYTVYRVNIGLI